MLRSCLLILLVVLIPVRSWAGEAMGLKAPSASYGVQHEVSAQISHCEMMQSFDADSDAGPSDHAKFNCDACSLCMAFAGAISLPRMSANDAAFQLASHQTLFVDIPPLALPLKPPIL